MDRSKFLKALGLGTVGAIVPIESGVKVTIEDHQKLEKIKALHQRFSIARKGIPKSEEHKKKLSEAKKGTTHSEDTKKKLSEMRKGIKLSSDTRSKISKSKKGKSLSEQHKIKISLAKTGKPSTRVEYKHSEKTREKLKQSHRLEVKNILQYTKDGAFIKEWENQYQAAHYLNAYPNRIRRCAIGQIRSAYGFIWKHKVVN